MIVIDINTRSFYSHIPQVEFLQSQVMSPGTFRKLSGRQIVPRPLPALIPRTAHTTQLNGSSTSRAEFAPPNGYSQIRKPPNKFGFSGSRGQLMVNTALQKTFDLEEKQKYCDISRGYLSQRPRGTRESPAGTLPKQQKPSQRQSSLLMCLPFSTKQAINIGSRNQYSKLLEQFSSDIDTRQPTFRSSAAQRKPTVCVDLTRDGRGATSNGSHNVELTDDDDDDNGAIGIHGAEALVHLSADGSTFKIPKSFPCAVDFRSPPRSIPQPSSQETTAIVLDDDEQASSTTSWSTTERRRKAQKVEPVNSLLEEWQTKPIYQEDWLEVTRRRHAESQEKRASRIAEEEQHQADMDKEGRRGVQDMIRKLNETLLFREVIVVEDEEEAQQQSQLAKKSSTDTPLPVFDSDQVNKIRYAAGRGSPDEVLITKFNQNITRRDIATLLGDSWLNDEVINFYMNLLMERCSGQTKYPKVYAMNTFFMPKVLQQGQSGVRRWTRKTDIFAYDVIPVPVHVSNIHWCMAIIHFRDKTIRYYDSMGQPNKRVLDTLEQYLKDESMDKRKSAFDTSGWIKESVTDCPRQMNGSDCGVFSCMFAEYVTRDHRINFSQDNMPYFRQKMILEICSGKLLL